MSNQKDPSLSAIENALEIIEKLEELDRAIERVQGHGNERSLSQGLEKGESMDQEKGLDEQHEGPEDDMEEKQEKDQDMQHELTRSRGGGREFGFGF
jgi:hypothetical protein